MTPSFDLELYHFGIIGESDGTPHNPDNGDKDEDGVSNLDELIAGTGPADPYNGVLPDVTMHLESATYIRVPLGGVTATTPFQVVVTDPLTLDPIPNAPVTVWITHHSGLKERKEEFTDVNGVASHLFTSSWSVGEAIVEMGVAIAGREDSVPFTADVVARPQAPSTVDSGEIEDGECELTVAPSPDAQEYHIRARDIDGNWVTVYNQNATTAEATADDDIRWEQPVQYARIKVTDGGWIRGLNNAGMVLYTDSETGELIRWSPDGTKEILQETLPGYNIMGGSLIVDMNDEGDVLAYGEKIADGHIGQARVYRYSNVNLTGWGEGNPPSQMAFVWDKGSTVPRLVRGKNVATDYTLAYGNDAPPTFARKLDWFFPMAIDNDGGVWGSMATQVHSYLEEGPGG